MCHSFGIITIFLGKGHMQILHKILHTAISFIRASIVAATFSP